MVTFYVLMQRHFEMRRHFTTKLLTGIESWGAKRSPMSAPSFSSVELAVLLLLLPPFDPRIPHLSGIILSPHHLNFSFICLNYDIHFSLQCVATSNNSSPSSFVDIGFSFLFLHHLRFSLVSVFWWSRSNKKLRVILRVECLLIDLHLHVVLTFDIIRI